MTNVAFDLRLPVPAAPGGAGRPAAPRPGGAARPQFDDLVAAYTGSDTQDPPVEEVAAPSCDGGAEDEAVPEGGDEADEAPATTAGQAPVVTAAIAAAIAVTAAPANRSAEPGVEAQTAATASDVVAAAPVADAPVVEAATTTVQHAPVVAPAPSAAPAESSDTAAADVTGAPALDVPVASFPDGGAVVPAAPAAVEPGSCDGTVPDAPAAGPVADAAAMVGRSEGASRAGEGGGHAGAPPAPPRPAPPTATQDRAGEGQATSPAPDPAVAPAVTAADAPAVTAPVEGASPTAGASAAEPLVFSSTPPVATPSPAARPDVPSVDGSPALAGTDGSSPWEQVAAVVRPLRRLPDGSHRVTLQLRPAELGSVQVEVALRSGRLSVQLVADSPAARSALQDSLPELRAELESAGVRTDALEVGARNAGASPGQQGGSERSWAVRARPTHVPAASPLAGEPSSAASRTVAAPGRVDVRL